MTRHGMSTTDGGSVRRWRRVTLGLTALIAAMEIAFVLMVAYAKPLLATPVDGPLTLGLLLGVVTTIAGWAVACGYIIWANRAHPAPEVAL
jgi:uncharacterized membrane protein (DUF485 family)